MSEQIQVPNATQLNEAQSKQQNGTPVSAAADAPVELNPDQVVEQLRTLRAQMPNVEPLTDEERALARRYARRGSSHEAIQASITVIGASEQVSQGVGAPAEAGRRLVEETNRWTAVEEEVKTLLRGIADANLIRRKRTGILASKAYGIARQVAIDDPQVRPHVKEIKRLRAIARRRKVTPEAPQTPQSPVTPDGNSSTGTNG